MKGIFGLAPGLNFPRAFVDGLLARVQADDPAALARTTVYMGTRRMLRAVEQELMARGALLLPRLRLVTDLTPDFAAAARPPTVSSLRRRLELIPLVGRLMAKEGGIAAEAAIFDLADSLAKLMEEMNGEGVLPDTLNKIDVAEHAAHWQRTHRFLQITARYVGTTDAPDTQALQRLLTEQTVARWQMMPPQHPVILAGSTGSRGTTRLLMKAIADLPQGVLVLPGFDFDTPQLAWRAMSDARVGEDHPQYRYCTLMADLGLDRVANWMEQDVPVPARNKLISLSLRPAPVTDQWMVEGRLLPDLAGATAGMTLIEAPSPRAEALSIALILRAALEEGKCVSLITPDRNLTRQVTAILDGWDLRPDDSAGEPLALTATGRFLRMVAALFGQKVTGEALLALLKHPATARGGDRGEHLRHTLRLELAIRHRGIAFPDPIFLRLWAIEQAGSEADAWAEWLANLLVGIESPVTQPLSAHLSTHFGLCEALARGPSGQDVGPLWTTIDGAPTLAVLSGLIADSEAAGDVTPAQFKEILTSVLQQNDVRRQGQFHPDLMIWGPREARVQGADLVVLSGLNDGIWPSVPQEDPWLNRKMRLQVGLLLPERQIGLSAHDYQQAICAPEVVLTRARRDSQAETVASRWVNRLTNLLAGLPSNGGPEALAAMRRRGDAWLEMAGLMDTPAQRLSPAERPSPRPPVADRPRLLSVTAIRTLMRDPYDVYANRILKLRPLQPLRPGPDPQLRGQVVHRILEVFLRNRSENSAQRVQLMAAADAILAEDVAWPTTRALWRARFDRAADTFLADDALHGGRPVLLEERRGIDLPDRGLRLTAQPDRIDVLPDGRLRIIDYKTGVLPTEKQQKVYDVQLLLEACMAVRGAFGEHLPEDVASIAYVGLGSDRRIVSTIITKDILDRMWDDLHRLLACYADPAQGYASRRALVRENDVGNFDHLARYGEWGMTDLAVPQDVGGDG
jgi:ATP-dependent helicase/nuclease subunit B